MSHIPKKLNDDGYTLIKEIQGGGQSITYILQKDGIKFLLKKPNIKEISSEQKFRFKQEAEALKIINGIGTPKVFNYSFDDDEPYILMEYIHGKTLGELVNGKPFSLERALDILLKTLIILEGIHEIGLLHRDIKPDNIIITESGDVFLIDFGLCRINTPNKEFKTPSSKELGNRFLRLPELGKGEKNPSSVSDLTFVIGLFFYMLSGHAPNQLLDEEELPPHKRSIFLEELKSLSWLMYTFDKGFAYQISQRFQSTEELREFIIEQRLKKENMIDDNPADHFSQLVNNSSFKRRGEILDFLIEAHNSYQNGVLSILSPEISYAMSGPSIQSDNYSVASNYLLCPVKYQNIVSRYPIYSTVSKDLSSISFTSNVDGKFITKGIYNVIERDRIINEYKILGIKNGKEAIRNLIQQIKTEL